MSPAPSAVDYHALVKDDRIHASLYTDPRVFDDEMERIFHRGWVFVGHDSEIPRAGDFVTRHVGVEPVVMVRGRDGEVTVMRSDAEYQAVVEFLYREARLADEARYAEWQALWTDDGVYWVPATTDSAADPDTHISHIYDNRGRIDTRIKLLQTGHRYSQEPASLMRRLISNIEVETADNGELVAESNFILAELAVQAKREMHWWVGRTTHRLRRVDGELRMCGKKVVLVNAAEPLPNLSFLI